MANFNTHLGFSTVVVSAVSAIAVKLRLFEVTEAPWYILIGIIGGMLPDIDSDNSKPVKRLFFFLSILSCIAVWRFFKDCLITDQLIVILLASYFLVRYVIFFFFQKMTVHRGIFHSLLAAVFFGLSITCLSYYYLKFNTLHAWYNGIFLSIGFVVHLCLDEIFSVDLNNGRMKKSFGTALKMFNYNDLSSSLLMFIFTVLLFFIAPPYSYLIHQWEAANLAFVDFQQLFLLDGGVNCIKSNVVSSCMQHPVSQ